VAIKAPLITTHYFLYINHLHLSVADVALN